jgi:enamine deaminase RidA (YjgF/YER057c/UK114 family)
MRRLISSGSPFEVKAGYSRAVVQGDWCFVSGTTGYDYATMAMPDTVEEQTRTCLATIGEVLQEAGFSFDDVVRCHYYVTDASFPDLVFPILGETFARSAPQPR